MLGCGLGLLMGFGDLGMVMLLILPVVLAMVGEGRTPGREGGDGDGDGRVGGRDLDS